ncbi:PH domain-containing protein [Streptomyces sp. NPDC007157]|uniref:PH domain-containing protein n=1 Tax=Streptomyces sp. NPDC007157 TaxID=3154681 RepID=UPI0034019CA9
MDEGGFEREYRKRRRPPGSYLLLLGVVLFNALLQTGRLPDDGDSGDWWGPPVFGLLIVVLLARVGLEQYRACTRVTSAGITARGPLRTRTWAWSEVYDIRVEPVPRGSGQNGPRWLTHLYDFDGRRFLLPHLDDWQLADPYAEVSELCLAADPQRSLDWTRRPDIEERILRGAVRRRARLWGGYGAVAMIVVMFVVSLALVFPDRADHPFLLLVCVPVASGVVLSAVLQWYWSTRPPRSLSRQPD